ncbi:HlyD family secretion protein [Azonexus caeni]|jgi:HlyD family secretion protein|uniref:HlyD family secretion protein n=1 Tax=Azonexus caeni TaxID=266126 RepID=UPI003A8567E8
MKPNRFIKPLIFGLLAAAAVAVSIHFYLQPRAGLPAGIVDGNGRLEATEVDVASKLAGRLRELLPREGDRVEAGAVVGRLDADELQAQLRAALAQVEQARQALAQSQAGVRKSRSDVSLAGKTLQRSEELVGRGFISRNKLDSDVTGMEGARAGMAQAQGKVGEAEAAVLAAQARVEALQATLADSELKAPVGGRVLYRLAEPGEVLAAGGKALTLVDLDDMFMSIYLSTEIAGRVALGAEARIVLDALPGQPIPASVTFVAPQAQFTPREVETRSEREKLMFRVKLRADPAWLAAHRDLAKGGMPGVGYVRLDPGVVWPAALQPTAE